MTKISHSYYLADLLSPRQAAQILGVSESTIRRWCDDERIPASRTHGKHRRIERSELIAFARREGLAIAAEGALTAGRGGRLASTSELAERMYRAMVSADATAVRQLAVEAIDHGVEAAGLCDDIIAPAMHRIGEDWESGRVQVYQEHAATQAALAAIMAVRAALASDREGAPVAVCAGLSNDPYVLGPAMSSVVLESVGFRSVLVGPDTPARQLALSLTHDRPRLLALSIGYVADPAELVDSVAAINRAAIVGETAVVIGGRGLDRDLRARMTADFFGDTMRHLASFASSLL